MSGMQSAVIHWGGKRKAGSHVISQCCFGCIATGLSISPSVGGGGGVWTRRLGDGHQSIYYVFVFINHTLFQTRKIPPRTSLPNLNQGKSTTQVSGHKFSALVDRRHTQCPLIGRADRFLGMSFLPLPLSLGSLHSRPSPPSPRLQRHCTAAAGGTGFVIG